MFYEVRVLDTEGQVRKVIPSVELSRAYWETFEREEKEKCFTNKARERIRRELKKRMALEYLDGMEPTGNFN